MPGQDSEPITLDNASAIEVWNALCTAMGGIDWSGLELQVLRHGIQDVEALMDALIVIKTHRPNRDEGPTDKPSADDQELN